MDYTRNNPDVIDAANKYRHIEEARKLIGVSEHDPKGRMEIDRLCEDFKLSGLKGKSQQVAWCSIFVGGTLERAGIDPFTKNHYVRGGGSGPGPDSSQYWLHDFGTIIPEPTQGCIVVFKWASGSGHTGYVIGQTPNGSLAVLGGNQSDAVNVKAFKRDRVVGYVWVDSNPPETYMPTVSADAATSTR